MKILRNLFLPLFLPGLLAFPQRAPDQPAARPAREVYHIEFVRAAPGKLPELLDVLKAGPHAPHPPRHFVFRHELGDHWDLMVLDPMGAGERVEAHDQAALEAWLDRMRALRAWHTDTFVSGPPLPVVRKALALGDDRQKAQTIYQVQDFAAAAGHRDELEKLLHRISTVAPGGSVVFDHLEGASWDFAVVSRFESWRHFADQQREADARARKAGLGDAAAFDLQLHRHMARHHDSFVSRVP